MRVLDLLAAAVLVGSGLIGCSSNTAPDFSDKADQPDPAPAADDSTGHQDPLVDDVSQYDDCLLHGVGGSDIFLGGLAPSPNPPVDDVLGVAECVAEHLKDFQGEERRYGLQSYETLAISAGPVPESETSLILRRISRGTPEEAPPQCLKIDMTSTVGATDVSITINSVTQLADTTPSGLCSDDGEN